MCIYLCVLEHGKFKDTRSYPDVKLTLVEDVETSDILLKTKLILKTVKSRLGLNMDCCLFDFNTLRVSVFVNITLLHFKFCRN